ELAPAIDRMPAHTVGVEATRLRTLVAVGLHPRAADEREGEDGVARPAGGVSAGGGGGIAAGREKERGGGGGREKGRREAHGRTLAPRGKGGNFPRGEPRAPGRR